MTNAKRYHLNVTGLERSTGEAFAASVAQAVFEASSAHIARVRIVAIPELRDMDPDAYARLEAETGVEFVDDWLETTLEATDDVVESVLTLFSPPLLKAYFEGTDEVTAFERHEYPSMVVTVPATAVDRFETALSPAHWDRLVPERDRDDAGDPAGG
jgi:hypothetical protein